MSDDQGKRSATEEPEYRVYRSGARAPNSEQTRPLRNQRAS